ncbi:hypothetical protein LINPERPRIM_LOCUS34011 [Linum perenne]
MNAGFALGSVVGDEWHKINKAFFCYYS